MTTPTRLQSASTYLLEWCKQAGPFVSVLLLLMLIGHAWLFWHTLGKKDQAILRMFDLLIACQRDVGRLRQLPPLP